MNKSIKIHCGSAYCRVKHSWHKSGKFLEVINCGAAKTRSDKQLKKSNDKLLAYHEKRKLKKITYKLDSPAFPRYTFTRHEAI